MTSHKPEKKPEWIDYIRSDVCFNLVLTNQKTIQSTRRFLVPTRAAGGGINVEYEEFRRISRVPRKKLDPLVAPNFIALSDAASLATQDSSPGKIIPHANEPAPAQRAGNVGFVWGKRNGSSIEPHRDEFPAVVLAVGLSKHYHYGKLHRNRHPAIKADLIAALWFERPNECWRSNGPSVVTLENYKEFWEHGEYMGHRWSNYNMTWQTRECDKDPTVDYLGEFLGNLKGTTDMFSNTFFQNVEDEVCYIADFA